MFPRSISLDPTSGSQSAHLRAAMIALRIRACTHAAPTALSLANTHLLLYPSAAIIAADNVEVGTGFIPAAGTHSPPRPRVAGSHAGISENRRLVNLGSRANFAMESFKKLIRQHTPAPYLVFPKTVCNIKLLSIGMANEKNR